MYTHALGICKASEFEPLITLSLHRVVVRVQWTDALKSPQHSAWYTASAHSIQPAACCVSDPSTQRHLLQPAQTGHCSRTRAPSGGCCLYSHLRPLQKDLGSFLPAPSHCHSREKGEKWVGEIVSFPRHFLCLLPDLGEQGSLRQGQEEMLGGGGSWLHDSPRLPPSHLLILLRGSPALWTPRATSREDTRRGRQCIQSLPRAIMRYFISFPFQVKIVNTR